MLMCQVGRTEMIKDTLSPDFVKHFIVDYFFEESQKLRFEVLASYICFIRLHYLDWNNGVLYMLIYNNDMKIWSLL